MSWLVVATLAIGSLVAHAQDEDAAQQAADQSFDAVMLQNAVAPAEADSLSALGYVGAPAAAPARGAPSTPPPPPADVGATANVPLDRYEAARAALSEANTSASQARGPLVVLGASTYTGKAIEGALSLKLALSATLAGPGLWKTVPLVGEDVVVVSARANGKPAALSRSNGYHVWITQQTGEVGLELDLLVPARGPRGSLEYDLRVARTPVTHLVLDFPTPGLEPRLRRAVRAEARPEGGGTRLDAWLEPTSLIHLVGYRAASEEEKREARVSAESLNLLSVDGETSELFTVFRYDILHAGVQRFDLFIPEGLSVVSADGEGAFRYALEPTEGGALLRGETAFPIRDRYELSLRLRRTEATGERTTVLLPRAVGVEREHGWLAVEVTGNLKLDEVSREDAIAIDARQLPAEVVESAVSPVLRAWRYHGEHPKIVLSSEKLPEKEPSNASIDRVVATTVVAAEGRAYTDLQITLRNRLRHSLSLVLPDGVEVRSSLLDGEPVKPSRDASGRLVLPLKRSSGGDDPDAFTLQLVLDSEISSLWLLGRRGLELPSLELPVSSLAWTVWLPGDGVYSGLEGDIEAQRWAGSARWYQPPVPAFAGFFGADGQAPVGLASSDAGAMPVRVELPRRGQDLTWRRYWVAGDAPLRVHFWYIKRWLEATVRLAVGLGVLGLVAFALRKRSPRRAWTALQDWRRRPPPEDASNAWASRSFLGKSVLVLAALGLAWWWGLLLLRIAWVLLRPLMG